MALDQFVFSDTIANSSVPNRQRSLVIKNVGRNKSTSLIILLRLFVGNVRFKSFDKRRFILQDIDYLDLNNSRSAIPILEKLKDYLASEITIDELGDIFSDRRFANSNFNFHRRLLNEYTNFAFHQSQKSFTTAFIYLYRILEMISIPFPSIYLSKMSDFNLAFKFIKDCTSSELTKDNSKGELGVFKTFVHKIFENDPIKDFNIEIKIDSSKFSSEVQKSYYILLKNMSEKALNEAGCTEFENISLKFIEMSSIVINIRNRFFHLFSANRHNIDSDEIYNTDTFFELINPHIASWFAVLYFEIVKFSISQSRR